MERTLSPEKNRPLAETGKSVPLVVDLDGTVVRTDLLIESLFALIKKNPFYVLFIPFWLLKGRAFLKREVTHRVTLDVTALPYNRDFLAHLRAEHAQGRTLVLATGNDEKIAHQVADHLQLFDRILASNGSLNLSHRHKQERLVKVFADVFEQVFAGRCLLFHDVIYPFNCSLRNTRARRSRDFTAGTEIFKICDVSSADLSSISRRTNTTR